MTGPARAALIVLMAVLLLPAAPAARAQMPSSLLMVNVSNEIVRANLTLTRIGVAQVGNQYTVGGTLVALGKKVPGQVVLRLVTSSGHSLKRSSPLQAAPFGSYGFLVFLPMDEGTIKMVTLSLK